MTTVVTFFLSSRGKGRKKAQWKGIFVALARLWHCSEQSNIYSWSKLFVLSCCTTHSFWHLSLQVSLWVMKCQLIIELKVAQCCEHLRSDQPSKTKKRQSEKHILPAISITSKPKCMTAVWSPGALGYSVNKTHSPCERGLYWNEKQRNALNSIKSSVCTLAWLEPSSVLKISQSHCWQGRVCWNFTFAVKWQIVSFTLCLKESLSSN